MSYKSLTQLYTEQCIGQYVPSLPRQQINFCLVMEGGAAGHMAHPFDLPQVKTGKNLISVFQKAIKSITTTPPSVKIDGVNTSIKLVTNEDGSMEFGLDRGSNKPLDVKGVTINELEQRFEQGHGMIAVGSEVLQIFNKALPVIQNELKKLGFFRKKLILNMEYVKGNTNVVGYADNFLAIHGVNEIYEKKSPVRGSISRATREIAYNQDAMDSLIEKVNKIAAGYDFKIMGSVPATPKGGINFAPELNSEFAVKYTPDYAETKRLGAWLDKCSNPRGVKVTLADGKKVDALSKFIYTEILRGTPLNQLIKDNDKKMVSAAVCGAIIYHATRMLGQKVLDSLTSPIGDIKDQEGIVIRDNRISSVPFKITGNFILSGLESRFAASENQEDIGGTDYLSNPNYSVMPPYSKMGGSMRVGDMQGY